MELRNVPLSELLSEIVDNRGRSCPTAPSGIPLIATNCVRNDSLYPTYENVRFVSRETHATWFRGHPEAGDIIFVNKGTPGRVCLVPDPVEFCIAQDMVAIRADHHKVYPKFLFAVLRSPDVQESIQQMHVGTMIPHFKKTDFPRLLIPVPTNRSLQEFIGNLYFAMSEKIDLAVRINQALEATAVELFKRWFDDLNPEHTIASELVNEGVLQIGDGYRAKNAEMREDGLPFIRAGNLNGGFDVSGAERLSLTSVQKAGDKVSRVGDVAFTSKGTIGRLARVSDDTARFVYSPQVCFWRSLDPVRLHPLIMYCWMQTDGFAAQVEAVSGQTDMAPYVSLRDQRRMAVPLFPESQSTVVRMIEPLLKSAALNSLESRSLIDIRDALLPRLLSGEVGCADAVGRGEAIA